MNPSTSGTGTTNAIKTVVLNSLKDLNDAIEEGNFDTVVKNVDILHKYISLDKDLLGKLHNVGEQYTTQLDLIISACMHKRAAILYYLLNGTDILEYMPETGLSEDQVNKKRTTVMTHAMCTNDFNMPEMLYDYWCGDTYWSGHKKADYVVNTMKRLGLLLNDAHAACKGRLLKEQKMLVDVNSLIKFNDFQCKLYSDIHELKSKLVRAGDTKNEGKSVGTLLLKVLRTYEYYSNIDMVRMKNSLNEIEDRNDAAIRDKDSIVIKAYAYVMYEVYFRKLDFTVSLIILENLTTLRNHLKKRFKINNNTTNCKYECLSQLYDKIECELFHFLYRTNEDWRLYLSANRPLAVRENRLGIENGQMLSVNLRYDEEKIYYSTVLFLERKFFKKHLKYLKRILIKHVICKAPKQVSNTIKKKLKKKKLLDDNYLKQMCFLRDNYSLQKIIHYIKVVKNSNGLNVLMIERTLQVIGEMMKSSEDSEHVSNFTKALLQTELSKETLERLHKLRFFLSKVDKGQLSRRIAVSVTNGHDQTFTKVRKDFEKMFDFIKPILDIYKLILDKSFVDKGLDLLNERSLQLPSEARRLQNEIIDRYRDDGSDFEEEYVQEVWHNTGLSRNLLSEITSIAENTDNLLQRRQKCIKLIANQSLIILPKHINNIKQNLLILAMLTDYIQEVKKDLKQYKIKKLPDWPALKDIVDTYGKLKTMSKTEQVDQNLLDKLHLIKDLIIDWACVKNVLIFFLYEIDRFTAQRVDFDNNVKNCEVPDQSTLNTVLKILDEMEQSCGPSQQQTMITAQSHTFEGIEDLDTNVYIEVSNSTDTTRMLRDEWIKCLITRIDQLTKLLDYPNQTLNQCQLRFKRDQNFHVMIEMLLADIANVLSTCKIRLMQKSGKMLSGIDLGNVLDHGNPFLEIISDIFDSHDYSSELLKKALMFAKDGDAIKALYKLYSDNISFEVIKKDDRRTMNDDQKQNLDTLKQSQNFAEYIKLFYFKN